LLDLGTGTGVLAIAAAKALRRAVLASDIDPLSVRVARENGCLTMWEIFAARSRDPASRRRTFPATAVRPGAGEYPGQTRLRQLAGPMARTWRRRGPGHPFRIIDASGRGVIAAYRARGLVPEQHLRIDG